MAYLVFRTTATDPTNPTDAERYRTLVFGEMGIGPRSTLTPLNPDYPGPKGLAGGLYVQYTAATVIIDLEFGAASASIKNQVADAVTANLLTVTSVAATYPAAGVGTPLTAAAIRAYTG